MRKMIFAVLAALVVVGTVAIVLQQRAIKKRAVEARGSRDQDELNEMKREIGTLRGELRATVMRGQLADAAKKPADSSGEAEANSAAEEPAEQLTPEEEHERAEAHISQVAQSFHAEVADRQWSSKVEAEISAVLSDERIKLNAASVECRAKTCRVELADNEPINQRKQLPMIANRMAGSLSTAVGHEESDGRGGTHMVMYLYKDGS